RKEAVGHIVQLVDELSASAARLQMGESQRPVGAAERTEGQVGGDLAHVAARPARRHGAASSAPAINVDRSFIIPERMRVFAVPSGMPPASLISFAVRPQMPASR